MATTDPTMGMLTKTWGPPLWFVLHVISFNYPVTPTRLQRAQYRIFMCALGTVLPCGACRRSYRERMREAMVRFPDPYRSRETFSRFVCKLHDAVTDHRGGVVPPVTYPEWRDHYEQFRARSCTTDSLGCTDPMYVNQRCVVTVLSDESKSMDMTCDVPTHDATGSLHTVNRNSTVTSPSSSLS